MNSRESSLRVVMLPWLAYGHISPFLELAKKLTERNIHIYMCSTPINLSFFKNKVTEKYSKSIELVELHLPDSAELPPRYHTSNGLPHHLLPTLVQAFEMSGPSVSKILETLRPDLVLYDINQSFTPEIASSLNIPAVQFISIGAVGFAFAIHMYERSGQKFPFPAIHIKRFDRIAPRDCDFSGKNGKDNAFGTLQRFGNRVLVFTFREIEGKYLDYLSSLLGKKMVPIGPIIQEPNDVDNDEDNEILKWLDKKGESSTVFVSFGSECFLTKKEMIEVAYGLEQSEVNFIWVVRFPAGEDVSLKEVLPEGFLDRVVGKRGFIVKGWAPQAKILGHPSTGGFVSHCGWNSLMESMQFGVPVIAMAMHLDQPFNARLLVELGMGIEVEKNDSQMYKREDIEKAIRKVVSMEVDGDHIRSNAREWREKIRSNGEKDMDEAVEELFRVCREQKK